jgi:hypothetical protein
MQAFCRLYRKEIDVDGVGYETFSLQLDSQRQLDGYVSGHETCHGQIRESSLVYRQTAQPDLADEASDVDPGAMMRAVMSCNSASKCLPSISYRTIHLI